MIVEVNGQEQTVADGATIADVVALAAADAQHRGAAVALNGRVVPRERWPDQPVSNGDRIDVVAAIQGG